MRSFDVAVLGVGGMGSAACHRLAQAGLSVLGIEQFDIPHTRGSSHGITRILRLGLHENPCYVPIVRRAVELWNELGATTGRKLFEANGSLDISAPDRELFRNSLTACLEHSVEHEILDAAELRKRHPALQPDADMHAVFQPGSGFVKPELSIITHVELAHDCGAEIHGREKVLGWDSIGARMQIRTDRDTYDVAQLVITAGAWIGKMLRPQGLIVRPQRAVLGWFQPLANVDFFAPEKLPVWILESPVADYFYGFPIHGIPGFKLGRYIHDLPEVDPDEPMKPAGIDDENELRQFMARYFPNGNGPVLTMATCIFEHTPDRAFIIDLLPGTENVWVLGGFSGHGFKYASAIGEIARDLVTTGECAFDLAPFRANRFA